MSVSIEKILEDATRVSHSADEDVNSVLLAGLIMVICDVADEIQQLRYAVDEGLRGLRGLG